MADTTIVCDARRPDHPAYESYLRRFAEMMANRTCCFSVGPPPCRYCGKTTQVIANAGPPAWCCDRAQIEAERPELPRAVALLKRHGYTVTPPTGGHL